MTDLEYIRIARQEQKIRYMTIVILVLAALSLMQIYDDFKDWKEKKYNLVMNQTEFDAWQYNACLQGCFNSVASQYGKIDYENATHQEIFLKCSSPCIGQFHQDFPEESNESRIDIQG